MYNHKCNTIMCNNKLHYFNNISYNRQKPITLHILLIHTKTVVIFKYFMKQQIILYPFSKTTSKKPHSLSRHHQSPFSVFIDKIMLSLFMSKTYIFSIPVYIFIQTDRQTRVWYKIHINFSILKSVTGRVFAQFCKKLS